MVACREAGRVGAVWSGGGGVCGVSWGAMGCEPECEVWWYESWGGVSKGAVVRCWV